MEIDHIAIAVSSLDTALDSFEKLFGLRPERTEEVTTDHVVEAMLKIGNTYLQLVAATDDESTVARFIGRRGEGLHHIAIRVDDIDKMLAHLKEQGATLVDDEPRIGSGGHRVAFLHPKASHGVLIELVERC